MSRTPVLLGFLAVLLIADVAVHRSAAAARAPLPSLEATPAEAIDWLVLHQGDDRIRLERAATGWEVVHPYRHPADPVAVEQLLSVLGAGVQPDARLGTGDLDRYGLSGADPVRVEAGSGEVVLAAVYVGADAPGGATFVRFANADAVYRARIGGRARFARPARLWRDPQLWRLQGLRSFTVDRDDGQSVTLERSDAGWELSGDPGFAVDPSLADAVAGALVDLRAVDVFSADHPADLDPPRAILTARAPDGTERTARLGLVGEDGFAAVDGREGTYRLVGRLAHRLVVDREGWRDHTLWSLDPGSLRRLEWIGPEGSARVDRDPRTGQWVGEGADGRRVGAAAGFLSRPRVERFVDLSAAQAGLPGERSLVIVGAEARTLQLGAAAPGALDGRDAVYVRAPPDPRIGLLEADTVARLLAARP